MVTSGDDIVSPYRSEVPSHRPQSAVGRFSSPEQRLRRDESTDLTGFRSEVSQKLPQKAVQDDLEKPASPATESGDLMGIDSHSKPLQVSLA